MDLDKTYVTIREIADVCAMLTIEVVAALVPNTAEADAKLEDLAGRLMDYVAGMPEGNQRALMGAIAETLVATEAGSSPEGWTPS